MTWIKLDTQIFRHKKMLALSDAHQLAYLRLLTWAGESADDGHIPDYALKVIPMTPTAARSLEGVGLLSRNGSGWIIHDWTDHQGSLIRRREADRIRKREQRSKGDET